MGYLKEGSLQDYLSRKFNSLKWKMKVGILYDIIKSLKQIHQQGIIHHDLHSGNILQNGYYSSIADLGLSIPVSNISESNENSVIGVLPYIAPEVLRGEAYTMASDIYSFGVLM